MPRIHCHVRRFIRGKPFPFVAFLLRTSKIVKGIDALIDTGSPFTVLSTKDALTTRLPLTKMQSGETVSLAGYRFFNHPLGSVIMNFRTETDELVEVSFSSMGALVPTKIDRKMLSEIKDIPTIIGNDFLEEFGLVLHYNPKSMIAYLES